MEPKRFRHLSDHTLIEIVGDSTGKLRLSFSTLPLLTTLITDISRAEIAGLTVFFEKVFEELKKEGEKS